MKQSLQSYLPVLNEAVAFSEFISEQREGLKVIAHCEEHQKSAFKDAVREHTRITVLIGPEGDFSDKEIELALKNNYLAVSLGNTRLRTETAAIAAAHTVALLNE